MTNPELIEFIKEARRRGFDDYEIRAPLLKEGWHEDEIDSAFSFLKEEEIRKERRFGKFRRITIEIDSEVVAKIEKRAKRNLMTLEDQITDILRRSAINKKPLLQSEKIDDLLVSLFSRRKRS